MKFSQIVNSVGKRLAEEDPEVIFESQTKDAPAEESFGIDDVEYRNGFIVLISYEKD